MFQMFSHKSVLVCLMNKNENVYKNNIFSEIIHDILIKIRRRKKNLTNIWQPFLNLYT